MRKLNGIHVRFAKGVEGGAGAFHTMFFGVCLELFRVQVAENDFTDKRVRLEERNETLGKSPDPHHANLDFHAKEPMHKSPCNEIQVV